MVKHCDAKNKHGKYTIEFDNEEEYNAALAIKSKQLVVNINIDGDVQEKGGWKIEVTPIEKEPVPFTFPRIQPGQAPPVFIRPPTPEPEPISFINIGEPSLLTPPETIPTFINPTISEPETINFIGTGPNKPPVMIPDSARPYGDLDLKGEEKETNSLIATPDPAPGGGDIFKDPPVYPISQSSSSLSVEEETNSLTHPTPVPSGDPDGRPLYPAFSSLNVEEKETDSNERIATIKPIETPPPPPPPST